VPLWEASELSNIVLGVFPPSTPRPRAYGGGRFNYQGDHRDRFAAAAELPERADRPMRHGSDSVKVNLINTRKPEQECRASSGGLCWWSSWPKLRLPSFAPNRAPGDIGIFLEHLQTRDVPHNFCITCASACRRKSSHARPQRRNWRREGPCGLEHGVRGEGNGSFQPRSVLAHRSPPVSRASANQMLGGIAWRLVCRRPIAGDREPVEVALVPRARLMKNIRTKVSK
jgi:hypothetical protein